MPRYTVSDASGKLVGVLDLIDSVASNSGLVNCRIVPEALTLEREIILGWLLVPTPAEPTEVDLVPEPFTTTDHFGRRYRIEHGNVATDAPTSVTLVPIEESNNDRTDGTSGRRG